MSHRLVRPSLVADSGEAWATIDTFNDREAADKARTRELQHLSTDGGDGGSETSTIGEAFAISEGIAACIVGGILMGVLAVFIAVWTDYYVTFRSGICTGFFWLNRRDCCPDEENCESWLTWGEFFGGRGSRHKELVDFFCFIFIGTMGAVSSAVLCKFYAVFAGGGGINEVKTVVSGHVFDRYFSGWTTVIKSIGVALSTSCGLAVGKEGPFVHIGACLADLVGGLFPTFENQSLRRELVAAGAGAGLAAAFGAPIGGVIFAIEEITSIFSFRVMIQTLIFGIVAVLVMKQFDVAHTGRIVQFSINFVHRWYWFELPLFAILGVFCGYVASFCVWLNLQIVRARRASRLRRWPITEVAIQIVIVNIINYIIPAGKLGLLEVLTEFWNECVSVGGNAEGLPCSYTVVGGVVGFFFTATVKMIMNSFAVGLPVPSGVLVPSLAIGALYGRAFGLAISALQTTFPESLIFVECSNQAATCVHPVAYAVVGGAAFLTGYTRMTVCLAVIMFELTGGLEYLVPVVVGIMCSKWAGESIGIESCYEIMIEENKLPYIDPKMEFHHPANAADILGSKKYVAMPATGMTIQSLNDLLSVYNHYTGFPVVVENVRPAGMSHTTSFASATSNNNSIVAAAAAAISDSKKKQQEKQEDSDDIASPIPPTPSGGKHITTTGGVYVGYIWRKSIIAALRRCEASDQMHSLTTDSPVVFSEDVPVDEPGILDLSSLVLRGVIQVSPTSSVQQILNIFKSLGARQVIVSNMSKFLGLITKKDLIEFMRKIEAAEHGGH